MQRVTAEQCPVVADRNPSRAGSIAAAPATSSVSRLGDPVLCGPCAVARWLQTHRVIVTKIATRAVADHLDRLKPLTGESSHVCREPFSVDDRAVRDPLLAPVTQWGQAPFPLSPMSPHAVSRQARDLLEGIVTVHRTLPVHRPGGERTDRPGRGPRSGSVGRLLTRGVASRAGSSPQRHRRPGRRRRRPVRGRSTGRGTGPANQRTAGIGDVAVIPEAPTRRSPRTMKGRGALWGDAYGDPMNTRMTVCRVGPGRCGGCCSADQLTRPGPSGGAW